VEAFHADHGTYLGMTLNGLKADYDAGLSEISLHELTATSFCVQTTVDGRTFRKGRPDLGVEEAAC
ncbi:MAG: hypothetical protein ACR2OD_05395, partial [Gaiellaceae bacterium]